jgi:hypothetical protein
VDEEEDEKWWRIEIEEKYSELSNFNRDENFIYGTLNRVELPTVTVYSE